MATKLVVVLAICVLSFSAHAQKSKSLSAKETAAQERAKFQADLKTKSGLGLTKLEYDHKFSLSGIDALCQVNLVKLKALAKDANLSPAAREEREIPLLQKETDKRCQKAYYEFVDIHSELRSRTKPVDTSIGGPAKKAP